MAASQPKNEIGRVARKQNLQNRTQLKRLPRFYKQHGIKYLAGFICCSLLGQTAPSSQPPTPGDTAPALRFQTFSVMDDPRHVGGEAYRILVPAGWRIEGSVIWKNAAADPAAPWIKLIGPGRQEIGVLPPTAFIWNPQLLGPRFRPGSFYNGSEVQPPLLDPAKCIKTIVIPRYQRNLDNADIVYQQPLPDLAEAGRLKYPQPEFKNAVFQAGKIRFEFVENGIAMQEDVYILIAAVQVQAGNTVTTLWAPDEIRYSKAPKGTLDAQFPLFETEMFSLRPNLQWWARVQEVSHELGRLQAQMSNTPATQSVQQQAAAVDRLYTERKLDLAGNRISDALLQGYKNHQSVMDRINEHWDRAVRQVESYRNPVTGENIELPSGFSAGWVNKNGDYLISQSASYDPNSASNGAWTRLEKVSP